MKEIVHQTLIYRPNGSVYNKEIWSFVLKQAGAYGMSGTIVLVASSLRWQRWTGEAIF